MSVSFPIVRSATSIREKPRAAGGWSFLARTPYQLLGALLVAVLLPAAIRAPLTIWSGAFGSSSDFTLLGTALAVLAGAMVLKRLAIYPGVKAPGYVVPIFTVAFAAVIAVFFFARLDYSRAQFILSYIFTVAWFFLVLRIERRVLGLRFLLVPFGNTAKLVDLGSATWEVAETPGRPTDSYSGIVADLRADLPPEWEAMLAEAALNGVPVFHSKFLAEALTGRVEIEHLSENHLGSLLPSPIYRRVRRFVDLAVAILAMPVALPIVALSAAAVRLVDGGPAFYRQERVGFRGKIFTVLKLRTMRASNGSDATHYTAENDPRITRTGRWLRKYRIDELPQLFNILKGDMGLIGPRPEAVPLAEWYGRQIPFYSYRHIVRPGITGWAAVNQGNVAQIAAATAKLHYDFYYIKHFSPWLDLLILAKTVRTVLTGFGAR